MNDEIYKKAIEMTEIARQVRIPDSVKKLVEMTEKFQENIPKIDIPQVVVPKFNYPQIDIPNFPSSVNSKLLKIS